MFSQAEIAMNLDILNKSHLWFEVLTQVEVYKKIPLLFVHGKHSYSIQFNSNLFLHNNIKKETLQYVRIKCAYSN